MPAKEMFEELEYVDFKENEAEIVYSQSFKLRLKEIIFNKMFHNIYIKNNILSDYSIAITYGELQAINKQIEELGWNRKEMKD